MSRTCGEGLFDLAGKHQVWNQQSMAGKKDSNSTLVYSTESGRMCPKCGKPVKACSCRKKQSPQKSDGVIRVGMEMKGRKGKGVTLITGIPLNHEELKRFGKQLKQRYGSGGTVKDGVVEIQGDHREALVNELKSLGYDVKRSGG